jgi:D-beta-D-heptose 7-phosphate kinase/D-beta-D-heptose 1-phosphate adenosyltransferase
MKVIAALESVSYVTWFDQDTPLELISELLPDVLVKGGDYKVKEIVGYDVVRKNGGRVRTLPFVEGRSTTSIINKAQLKR